MTIVRRLEKRIRVLALVRNHDAFVTSPSSLITECVNTGQVGKVLGEKWKALNPKQREPYEQKAKADKERYESEKANYAVSLGAPLVRLLRECALISIVLQAGGDDEESEE